MARNGARRKPAEETIYALALAMVACSVLFAVVSLLLLPGGARTAGLAMVCALPTLSAALLVRAGRPSAAAWVLVANLWLMGSSTIWFGGVDSVGNGLHLVAVAAAGFLIGGRAAVGVGLAGLAVTGGAVLFQGEWLPARELSSPAASFWAQLVVLITLTCVVWIGLRQIRLTMLEAQEAEKQRRQLEAQLYQSQKLEAVGQLAGGVAHDFNNYLTVILGHTEELLEADTSKREPLSEIRDAALLSAELTKQLLAFSRKQVLQPIVLDLNQVIRRSDRLLRRVLGDHIALETVAGGGLGRVKADAVQIEQSILNLALNARAAMPDGGTLTIETGNVYLDTEYAATHLDVEPGRYVMLAVSDSGTGMDPATRERIFEPFFTTRSEGNGLGLSTVLGIVKQSGGSIGVYTEPGVGTTFRIYLPRVDEEAEDPTKHVAAELVHDEADSGTILVVEDQEMVRRLIEHLLEARGFTVLTATNRDEAIELAESRDGAIDLLLTDIVLPGPTGPEIAKELGERYGIRTLYVTGFTENGIVSRGILKPNVRLLQKPFTATQLIAKVRDAIKQPLPDEPDD